MYTCKICGEEFLLSKDDEELISDGLASSSDITHCQNCVNRTNGDTNDMYSDTDCGL